MLISLLGTLTSFILKEFLTFSKREREREGVDEEKLHYLLLFSLLFYSISYSPLYFVGMKIFDEFRVCETLMISDNVMASWLKVTTCV